VAEDEILLVLDAALAVEVDVEQLALVERLGDAGGVVQVRHLLVSDLRVHAHEVRAFQGRDEGKGVSFGSRISRTRRNPRERSPCLSCPSAP